MKMNILHDTLVLEVFRDSDDYAWLAEEPLWRGIAVELEELHYLKGASFIKQLKQIIYYGDFHPVEGETGIFSTGGEKSADYDNLLNAVPAKP
jgi:hypothetical protein